MAQTQKFTQGRIFAPLIPFALPVLPVLLLQTTYGAVDVLAAGQFGTAAVSLFHVGLATPAFMAVQIVFCGVCFMILRERQRKETQVNKL